MEGSGWERGGSNFVKILFYNIKKALTTYLSPSHIANVYITLGKVVVTECNVIKFVGKCVNVIISVLVNITMLLCVFGQVHQCYYVCVRKR